MLSGILFGVLLLPSPTDEKHDCDVNANENETKVLSIKTTRQSFDGVQSKCLNFILFVISLVRIPILNII